MRLAPGVVVVVVDAVGHGPPYNLADALDDPLPACVGVLAGQRHAGDILLAELAVLAQECRIDINAVLPSAQADELRRCLVAEPARSEMHADPDPAVLVLEQIDIVIARADRAELVTRHALEFPDLWNLVPKRAIEELVLDVLGVAPADSERDVLGDVGENRPDFVGDRVSLHVEAHRHVAAADVEADAAHRYMLFVGDHTTDRLRITKVAVGAEHAAGDAADRHAPSHLLFRVLVVVSEDFEPGHWSALPLLEFGQGGQIRTADLLLPRQPGTAWLPYTLLNFGETPRPLAALLEDRRGSTSRLRASVRAKASSAAGVFSVELPG